MEVPYLALLLWLAEGALSGKEGWVNETQTQKTVTGKVGRKEDQVLAVLPGVGGANAAGKKGLHKAVCCSWLACFPSFLSFFF